MRHLISIFAMLCLVACVPAGTTDFEPQSPEIYEASEFEPNWSLKMIGEEILEFTQLDPIVGAEVVTYSYWIDGQITEANVWMLYGSCEHGEIVLRISKGQNCSHSGSGYLHRDTVDVQTQTQNWRGCGGPILE